jgi:hypothetical protein
MSYEIGYKKPPPDKRFKKGQGSSNPKGRPKGSNNFMTLLEKELRQPMTITENGKKRTTTRLGAMTKRLVVAALQSDYKALITLLEILRKNGRLEVVDVDDVFVDDHEAILEAFVTQRMKARKSTKAGDAAEEKAGKP